MERADAGTAAQVERIAVLDIGQQLQEPECSRVNGRKHDILSGLKQIAIRIAGSIRSDHETGARIQPDRTNDRRRDFAGGSEETQCTKSPDHFLAADRPGFRLIDGQTPDEKLDAPAQLRRNGIERNFFPIDFAQFAQGFQRQGTTDVYFVKQSALEESLDAAEFFRTAKS